MLVSIIIVNWNTRDLLRECLNSIYQHTRLSQEDYEIIVIDNASADASVAMVQNEFTEVKLIASQENQGFGKGCNQGFAIASGDFILLLNPDTRLISDTVSFMLNRMREELDIAILGCRMIDDYGLYRRDSGGFFPSLKNVAWNYLFLGSFLPNRWKPKPFFLEQDPQGELDVDWISGADMMIKRQALNALEMTQLFDEEFFMYGEDLDFCHRIKGQSQKNRKSHQNSLRIVYTSEHTLVHNQGGSISQQTSIAVLSNLHKGPRRFFSKTHSLFALFIYDLIMLLGYAIRWPSYRLLSLINKKRDYHQRANFSKQYLGIMLKILLQRKQ